MCYHKMWLWKGMRKIISLLRKTVLVCQQLGIMWVTPHLPWNPVVGMCMMWLWMLMMGLLSWIIVQDWLGLGQWCHWGCFVVVQVDCGITWWVMWWKTGIRCNLWLAGLVLVWIVLSKWMALWILIMSLSVICSTFHWIQVVSNLILLFLFIFMVAWGSSIILYLEIGLNFVSKCGGLVYWALLLMGIMYICYGYYIVTHCRFANNFGESYRQQ